MNVSEQLNTLAKSQIPNFSLEVSKTKPEGLKRRDIEIFQINVGKLCNLQCSHCHVEAGPDKIEENMGKEIFDHCLTLIKNTPSVTTVDLTGGAPEMNPHLKDFIQALSKLKKRVIVRSNLTVLAIPKYAPFLDFFAEHNVEIVASLPCYLEDNTDAQRGKNVFKKSIAILQELNKRGYGIEGSGRHLHLVHNPVGTGLAPEQSTLETAYKAHLKKEFDVEFNSLFCITNLPISRYLDYLVISGDYEQYMAKLHNAYNPHTLDSVMCRNTLSISWDGRLYDCDFNQMLGLPLSKESRCILELQSLEHLNESKIATHQHCYGCTAGAGSSCQGALDSEELACTR